MKPHLLRRSPICRRRRGYSLIELVAVMAIAMIIMGIAVTTIHLLLRADRHSAQAVWHNTSIAQLSRTLRDDTHGARQVAVHEMPDGMSVLQLTLDGSQKVSYEIEQHEIVRTVFQGDVVKNRNSFFAPVGSSLRFEPVDEGTAVRLMIQRAPLVAHAHADAGRMLTIEAVAGRRYRFEGTK
jgi:Tfp pilus assembly protein FimT